MRLWIRMKHWPNNETNCLIQPVSGILTCEKKASGIIQCNKSTINLSASKFTLQSSKFKNSPLILGSTQSLTFSLAFPLSIRAVISFKSSTLSPPMLEPTSTASLLDRISSIITPNAKMSIFAVTNPSLINYGAIYPWVPTIWLVNACTWEPHVPLDISNPMLAIFVLNLLSRRILLLLRSLWTQLGLVLWWRYSNPSAKFVIHDLGKPGIKLVAPLRCGCTTTKQMAKCVKFLLTYITDPDDDDFNIVHAYFISANKPLPINPTVYPYITLLIPLNRILVVLHSGPFPPPPPTAILSRPLFVYNPACFT